MVRDQEAVVGEVVAAVDRGPVLAADHAQRGADPAQPGAVCPGGRSRREPGAVAYEAVARSWAVACLGTGRTAVSAGSGWGPAGSGAALVILAAALPARCRRRRRRGRTSASGRAGRRRRTGRRRRRAASRAPRGRARRRASPPPRTARARPVPAGRTSARRPAERRRARPRPGPGQRAAGRRRQAGPRPRRPEPRQRRPRPRPCPRPGRPGPESEPCSGDELHERGHVRLEDLRVRGDERLVQLKGGDERLGPGIRVLLVRPGRHRLPPLDQRGVFRLRLGRPGGDVVTPPLPGRGDRLGERRHLGGKPGHLVGLRRGGRPCRRRVAVERLRVPRAASKRCSAVAQAARSARRATAQSRGSGRGARRPPARRTARRGSAAPRGPGA